MHKVLLNEAKDAGITTIMDPKLSGLGRAIGADVAIFERRGIELIQRRQLLNDETETIAHLFAKYEWKAMLVIGGVHGTTLHQADGTMEHHPCRVLNPKQQLGLHDAFSSMSYALLCGTDFGDAACLAHAACEVILNADASREFVSKGRIDSMAGRGPMAVPNQQPVIMWHGPLSRLLQIWDSV